MLINCSTIVKLICGRKKPKIEEMKLMTDRNT